MRRVIKATPRETLQAWIAERDLKAGDRLPPERALAAELGLSRAALREAVKALAAIGLLQTRHGSGTRVVNSSGMLSAPIELLIRLDRPPLPELYAVRSRLEAMAAELAAERQLSLGDLRAATESLESACDEVGLTEANVAFHEALAAASGNPVLARLLNALNEAIRGAIYAAWPLTEDVRASVAVHRAIYEAVAAGDRSAAREAMEEHMRLALGEIARLVG